MRHFIQSLYPGRIDVILKREDGVTINRLRDVERCPCLGCDSVHNKHNNVEMHAKVHKEMYANEEALQWFLSSIRAIL
jgi:hypothetical protein